jgi:pimeloyl-ACP methyl ester carboxylesterase
MNEIKQEYAEVNNTRLYYEITGQGHPIVLIHGMNLNHTMWNPQVQELSKHNTVIRYDLRGYGKSANPKEDEPYSNHTDLKALLDYLNIRRTHLLGLSMGGGVAINFTLEHPEYVSSLIPVDSSLAGYNYSSEFLTWIFSMFQIAKTSGLRDALDTFVDGELFKATSRNLEAMEMLRSIVHSHKGWSLFNQATQVDPEPAPATQLHKIKCPTLIVVGEYDIPDFQGIANKITNDVPNAKKCVIEGVGHISNLEDPLKFNKEILSFLASF